VKLFSKYFTRVHSILRYYAGVRPTLGHLQPTPKHFDPGHRGGCLLWSFSGRCATTNCISHRSVRYFCTLKIDHVYSTLELKSFHDHACQTDRLTVCQVSFAYSRPPPDTSCYCKWGKGRLARCSQPHIRRLSTQSRMQPRRQIFVRR
jgi:hypothetical protein